MNDINNINDTDDDARKTKTSGYAKETKFQRNFSVPEMPKAEGRAVTTINGIIKKRAKSPFLLWEGLGEGYYNK